MTWPAPGPARPRGVLYLTSTSSSLQGAHPDLGVMVNALTGSVALGVQEGRTWGLDNGAYSGRFDPATLCAALDRYAPWRHTCAFVVSPDVPGDGPATLNLLGTWAPALRRAGYRAAVVLHPGVTRLPDCDALFIPASNLLDPHVPRLAQEARLAGKWVHVGRVNSERRTVSMARLGAHSVDGTYVAFTGVQRGVATITGWVEQAAAQAAQPRLLTEDLQLEDPAAYRARTRPDRSAAWARQYGARPLTALPPDVVRSGLHVGYAGRVGVLLAPPEDGEVLVAFTDEDSGETYPETVSVHATYGPVTLGAPQAAQRLDHWQITGTVPTRPRTRAQERA